MTTASRHSDAPETETETNKKRDTVANATKYDLEFEEAKKVYPKRKGSNPWIPAKALFIRLRKSGVPLEKIIGALKAGVGFDRDQIGTEYIPQFVKWLRDRRFDDFETVGPVLVEQTGFYASFSSKELEAWEAYERTSGKKHPRDRSGGWRFPTQWPPDHQEDAA